MLRLLFRSCLLLATVALRAGNGEIVHGTVHRDTIWAPTLGVRKQMLVYLPTSYDTAHSATKRYPVAVYLHGRWGDETDLVLKAHIAESMDSLVAIGMPEMIVVMPDGDDGWWINWATAPNMPECRRTPHRREPADEFCVPTPRYDDYIVNDVLAHIDSTYRTLARGESRGIAGLSMGGYGAVAIAALHPGIFGAAVSHGGVLTPGVYADSSQLASTGVVNWRDGRTMAELQKGTGQQWPGMYPMFGLDTLSWQARDPARLLIALKARGKPLPALYADMAQDDERLEQNRVFRRTMKSHDIPVQYVEWPGKHSWIYWNAHVPQGLRFIAEHVAR
jgi:S-formylglutathione hydrolase FrmB